jgi:hypothetical protein
MVGAEGTVAAATDLTSVAATMAAVTKWSRGMREREEGDDMWLEGIKLEMQ